MHHTLHTNNSRHQAKHLAARALTVILFAIAAAAPLRAQQVSFLARTDVSVGGGPRAVGVGDFNNDARQDLVTANYQSQTVALLLGSGDGTFDQERTFEVGGPAFALAVGDFNADAKLDIAVANREPDEVDVAHDTVAILMGRGDGTFEEPEHFAVGRGASSIAVGDFNGDGKLDLVTANNISDSVSILIGRGDGRFDEAQHFSVGSAPASLTVGDFNGDGRLDVATASPTSSDVSVLINSTP